MPTQSTIILVAGEALVDLIPPPGGGDTLQVVLGGSPFNTAIGLGRLGAPTAYAGRLSLDANGERFAQALSASGVSLDYVARHIVEADAAGAQRLRKALAIGVERQSAGIGPKPARLCYARHRRQRAALCFLSARHRL